MAGERLVVERGNHSLFTHSAELQAPKYGTESIVFLLKGLCFDTVWYTEGLSLTHLPSSHSLQYSADMMAEDEPQEKHSR